jgi:hypothetical protein
MYKKTYQACCITWLRDAVVGTPALIIKSVCILAAQGGLLCAARSQASALAASTLFLKQKLPKSSYLKRLVKVPFEL